MRALRAFAVRDSSGMEAVVTRAPVPARAITVAIAFADIGAVCRQPGRRGDARAAVPRGGALARAAGAVPHPAGAPRRWRRGRMSSRRMSCGGPRRWIRRGGWRSARCWPRCRSLLRPVRVLEHLRDRPPGLGCGGRSARAASPILAMHNGLHAPIREYLLGTDGPAAEGPRRRAIPRRHAGPVGPARRWPGGLPCHRARGNPGSRRRSAGRGARPSWSALDHGSGTSSPWLPHSAASPRDAFSRPSCCVRSVGSRRRRAGTPLSSSGRRTSWCIGRRLGSGWRCWGSWAAGASGRSSACSPRCTARRPRRLWERPRRSPPGRPA